MIAFFLLRRRRDRERTRALAHESFGPGIIPRSGSSQSRHAPSPSLVAFLGIGRSRSRGSNYDDDDEENRGFFGRIRGMLAPRRKEDAMREKGIEHIREKPAEVYERSLGVGDGSFLPPLAPVRSISPLAPFGATPDSDANVNVADPFLDPPPKLVMAAEGARARAPSPALPPSIPIPHPAPVPTQKEQSPRPDDPFWDPDDLLPPALRLSALKKQTAAWKASAKPTTTTTISSSSGTTAGSVMTNASAVPSSVSRGMERADETRMPSPGLIPQDPFADPGMQLDRDENKNNTSSPSEEDKSVIIPDIFDYRASTGSSDVGAGPGGERDGYNSWVSQPGWTRSVRSSTTSSSSSSAPQVIPPLPLGSRSTYSSDGPSSMSSSSVLASSIGSGVGIAVEPPSESSSLRAPADDIALGMLRSQSPDEKYGFGFFRGDADGASDGGHRMSIVSGESYETGKYQVRSVSGCRFHVKSKADR